MSMTWQCGTKRSTRAATHAAPGKTVPHCGICDGLLEHVCAVEVEQAARLDPALDEDVNVRSGGAESSPTSGWSGASLAAHDLGTMIGMLELLAVTPGARMVSDDVGAIEKAD